MLHPPWRVSSLAGRYAPSIPSWQVQTLESLAREWTLQIRREIDLNTLWEIGGPVAKGPFRGPLCELDFWQKRHDNLYSLSVQLQGDSATTMLAVLRSAGSSYAQAFVKLAAELEHAVQEAHDLTVHYETLRLYLKQLRQCTIEEMAGFLFPVMLHLLALVWFTSRHITSTRLIILLQLICNDIIAAVAVPPAPARNASTPSPPGVRGLQQKLFGRQRGPIRDFWPVFEECSAILRSAHGVGLGPELLHPRVFGPQTCANE